VARACGSSKAITRRFSLAAALAAALSGIPISWRRVSTSERFTALMEAFVRREGSNRVKGSPTNKAITADASATTPILFTRRLGSAFVDQLLYQIASLRQVLRYNGLRFPNRLFSGAQAQFTLPDRLDQQFIAGLQAGRRAAFGRDYNTTLLIDPSPSLHDTSPHICHNASYMASEVVG
jgi:hypothetical protein